MTELSGTAVSVTVHAHTLTVDRHTEHPDGQVSLSVDGTEDKTWQTPRLYLCGTEADLERFGRAIVAQVTSNPGGYNDPPVPIADDLRTAADALDGRDPSNESTVEIAQRVMREAADAIDRVAREDAADRPTVTDEETRAGIAAVEAAQADRLALDELRACIERSVAHTSTTVAAIIRRVRP